MHANTLFAVAALALSAAALPAQNDQLMTVGPNGNAACGNGQVVSCCNKKQGDVIKNPIGLIPIDLLSGFMGGNCSPLDISGGVGGAVPIHKACGGNQAACCTGSQTGLINVACNNFSILKK